MSDTKTVLDTIKDEYAREQGRRDWKQLATDYVFCNLASVREDAFNEIALRYATACCKATQEKCADNAMLGPQTKYPELSEVDRESITDPDNIVLL